MSLWSMAKYIWFSITGRGAKVLPPEQGSRTQALWAVMRSSELVAGAFYADRAVSQEADAAKNLRPSAAS